MKHLLVTNDFPPKIGGIQTYLYELWSRLPAGDVTVLTTRHPGSASFDRQQSFRIVRSGSPVLLPSPGLVSQVTGLARDVGARLVVLDPALPVGLVGSRLSLPYAVVLHGAEITVPGRLPLARALLASVLAPAKLLIAAGGYPAAEARRVAGGRTPPVVIVPPGVDTHRFRVLSEEQRRESRTRLGLPAEGRLVVSVSRLVPRKGMDVLIEAVAALAPAMPDLCLAIGGQGRDRPRLEALAAKSGAPVRMLGRVADDDLPALDGACDVWAMLCRDRWLGLEQEGFGIVFLEAAAAGVPQVAGRSGGAEEAVVDGETGIVVADPGDHLAVAAALQQLLEDEALRKRYGNSARKRAESDFDYDVLAERLRVALGEAGA
ncbi:MAG TPA: glycosyltransferase family 4 protein [Acidimicrobiales bacterium]|nr:glycosyltransferase family 4 protein [Acidimicrobiales bacterium]